MLVSLNLRDRPLFDVYRLDLNTGALEKDTENPSDVTVWSTDPDFQIRGAQAMTPDGGTQLRVDDASSPWRSLVTWAREDNLCSGIGFTPDGEGVYLRDSRDADTMRLVQIDTATRKRTILASDPEYDIGSMIIHPRTHQVQAVSFIKERSHWQVLDHRIEKDIEAIRKIHHGNFFVLNRDSADKNWLIGITTGYGKKFLNAGNREWGAKMHDDLIDGVSWAIKEGIADPSRIAIYGGSYGGYAALVGATFTPDVFVCAVDVCGPSNILTLIKSIPPYWEPMRKLFDERVGDVDTEEEFLKSRSPLFKADQIKIPLLIGQGANDPRVKQAESEQIVEALRGKGKPLEYIVFPDEGHGFVRPENRLKFYAAAEAFWPSTWGQGDIVIWACFSETRHC